MLKPTLPRAFIIKPDGSTTSQHRLLHKCRTDQDRPAGRHLHHQPASSLVRRHADHVGGHKGSDPRLERQGQSVLDRQPRRCRTRRVRDSRGRRPAGRDDVRQAVRGMEGHVLGQRNAAAPQHDVDSRGVQQGAAGRPRTVGRTVRRRQGGQVGPADRADAQPELVGYASAAGLDHVHGPRPGGGHTGASEQRDRRGGPGLAGRPASRSGHARHLDSSRPGCHLVSLHVQRGPGLDPRRPETAVGDHESH